MLQIVSPKEPFDAIVVGSGATGGWAAKELTAAGMRVALLEAGASITPRDFTEHQQSWQLPYLGHSPLIRRGRPIQGLCYAWPAPVTWDTRNPASRTCSGRLRSILGAWH